MPGFVLWFTGLSGSGKSTLTAMVSAELRRRGVHVETLDGDEVRKHLSKGLGFSREDRDANIRRIGFVARLVARSGGCAIAAAISPYREIRNEIRRSTDRFCEVYTECPIDVLAERDPKGLYKKALAGLIKNFTGVDDPYQAPEDAEVHLHTDTETPEQSLGKILAKLEELGFIPAADQTGSVAADANGGLVPPHGRDLVDRMLRGDLLADARERAPSLPALSLDAKAAAELGFVGCGAYSPLKGFVGSKDYARIVAEARLESGIPWALPLTLSISREEAKRLGDAPEIALRSAQGEFLGLLALSDVFEPDRPREAESRFGTCDTDSPAVAALLAEPPICIGGEVRSAALPSLSGALAPVTPREARLQMTRRGWQRVVALDLADAIVTTAHEYILRAGLEFGDGLLVRASAGLIDAVPLALRLDCLRDVFGGYFAATAAILSPAPAANLLGPRAVLHSAIVAQNFGASVLLVPVGTDAGPPRSADLSEHQAELALELWPYSPPGRSGRVGSVATRFSAPTEVAPAPPLEALIASLKNGDAVAAEWLRPEVAMRLRRWLVGG